jgi:hypothetical protein
VPVVVSHSDSSNKYFEYVEPIIISTSMILFHLQVLRSIYHEHLPANLLGAD